MSDRKITTDGIEELMADLLALGELGEDNLDTAIKQTTGFTHRTLVEATPGKTGAQKREWAIGFPERLVGEVTTNSKILWFLEHGTGLYTEAADGKRAKYKIAPKFKKALAWQGSGGSFVPARDQGGQIMRNAKGGILFRTAKGGVGTPRWKQGAGGVLDAPNLAKKIARKFVMHPGIKPVRMLRNNLQLIEEDFEQRLDAALDATVKGVRLGP